MRKFLGISAMAVLLFGGVFALVPALIVRINGRWDLPRWEVLPGQLVGLALMAAGVFLYVYCASVFVRRGRGTTSPVNRPNTSSRMASSDTRETPSMWAAAPS